MTVVLPEQLPLTGCITRSTGCDIEEVKKTLSLAHIGEVWSSPKAVGKRNLDKTWG
jgi:hypothetical protein